MLRTFILALACHAVVGFQVAMRPAAMPLARAAAPTMLVELPTMLDVPTTLLAKSEADALLDTFFSSVFPLGTLAGIAFVVKELVGNTLEDENAFLSGLSVAVTGFFTLILLAFAGQTGYGS